MSFLGTLKNQVRTNPKKEKRILLIDDQLEFLIPLNLILSNLGVSATLVFDGFAARRALVEKQYDLVVIDWKMPELSGEDCLAFTDTTLYLNNNISREPIPYVTYSGLEEGQIIAPETQFFYRVAHWRKPLSVSQLTQRVLTLLDRIA